MAVRKDRRHGSEITSKEVPIMKRGIAVVSLFVLLTFAFAAVTAPATEENKMSKKARKLMDKALEAIKEKQPDQAIDLLRQVVVMEPENAMLRHNLGVLYFEKGLADEAIASFEDALRLQPDYQKAQLALRQALFEAGKDAMGKQKFDKSNEYLLKLKDLPYIFTGKENDSMLAFARFYLGYNFFNLKQYPQAQANFELCQAMEGLETEDLDLYGNAAYFIGMIDYIKNQYEDSVDHFQKYLKLYVAMENKPEFFTQANYFIGANLFRLLEARMARGDVARMAESAAEILPYLNVAVENKIPSEDAYVMLGNCHVYLKEYDQAVQAYQRLIELFPQSPQLKSYQAFLEQLQKMQQPAAKAAKKKH
jgi:tetratricopeptide (TPR) repeat protein